MIVIIECNMKTQKITLTELKSLLKKMIKENYSDDYEEKYYSNLLGVNNLEKYPQDFIDWLNQEDSWAETIIYKNKITKLIDLFDLWLNEKY